jgi:hypothetical protein
MLPHGGLVQPSDVHPGKHDAATLMTVVKGNR